MSIANEMEVEIDAEFSKICPPLLNGEYDLLFYSNQILDWIECNGEHASESDMQILKKLAMKLNQFIHKN